MKSESTEGGGSGTGSQNKFNVIDNCVSASTKDTMIIIIHMSE